MTRFKKKNIFYKRTGGFGEVWLKAITDNASTMEAPVKRPHSTGFNIMKTPIDLLIEAQDNQLKVVAGNRLAVLKSQDDLKKFRGEDDYQIAVSTIVKEYPEGIVLTRLREVLPDSVILEKAVKSLVEKKEITTESYGKRTQLLKLVMKQTVQTPQQEVVEVNTNPTGDPKWESAPAASTKPTPKSTNPADDTQE